MRGKITKEGLEFDPPKGFVTPEAAAQGKPFDLVCTFYTKPDGTMCMTKLGDADLTGKGEDDEDESEDTAVATNKPNYSEYSKGLMGGMEQSMGGGEMA